MKLGVLFACSAALLAAPDLRTSLPGVWKGALEGVPAVEVRIDSVEPAVRGSVKFTLVVQDGNGASRAGQAHVVPILDPRLDGSTLYFNVARREDKVAMSLELSGEDKREGVLRNLESPEMAVKVVWSKL